MLRQRNTAGVAILASGLIVGGAPAALVVQDFQRQNLSSIVLTNTYTAVAVQAGDVVVMTAASNKKDSAAPITFSSTAGALTLVNTVGLADPYPAAYSAYVAIGTNGTYDFEAVAGGAVTASSGLYILRADSSTMMLLASAMYADHDADTQTPQQSLSYAWGGSTTNGLVIEAISSRTETVSPVDVGIDFSGSDKRLLTSGTFSGSAFSSTYDFTGGTAATLTSSGVGLAFAEGSVAPQPPAFDSDPVVKAFAVQDEAYTASLAENASDPNGDPMTFSKAAGPGWLNVAANGDLTGTPLAGDLGTNTWTVSVTDGISGTNSATLEIAVVSGPPAPQTNMTNIVFIVIDDLGWMDLSVQGSDFYETPRIDQLAQSGMRFAQAYASHPRCLPSRYGFMTGRFPGANGVHGGPENNLRPVDFTIAEALKAGGYATFFAGKWHLIGTHGADNLPQNQGFDTNVAGGKAGAPPTYFYPYRTAGAPPTDELDEDALYFEDEGVPGEYLTDRLTDEALDWMTWNADQPFFLCLWHYGVHTPYEAPAGLIAKYEAKLPTMDYGGLPEYISSGVGQQKMRQDHPTYAAMIESVDTNVGRVLDRLDALGISSNTVVILTSDNGGLSNRGGYSNRELATSNHPLRTGKGWLYEGGIREALIVKGPGIPAVVNSNAVVNGTDVYPTLLEIAGLPLQPSNHLDGVSFKSALNGGPCDRGKPIFWHCPLARPYATGDFNSSAVRDGDYKLIWWYDTPGQPYELYNVKTDIGENDDLSETMPAKAAELLAKIQAWHAGAHEGSGVIFKVDIDDVAKPPAHYLDDPSAPVGLTAGGGVNLWWDDWIGYDYNVWMKTNLLDAAWTLHLSGIAGTNAVVPLDNAQAFFRLDLLLQPEN